MFRIFEVLVILLTFFQLLGISALFGAFRASQTYTCGNLRVETLSPLARHARITECYLFISIFIASKSHYLVFISAKGFLIRRELTVSAGERILFVYKLGGYIFAKTTKRFLFHSYEKFKNLKILYSF